LSFATQCTASTSRTAAGSISGTSIPSAELRSTRKPRLLFRLSGVFLLRFAERQFLALLFQLPPRFTRFEPHDRSPADLLTRADETSNCERHRQL
jgi:hypothetical protein